MLNMDGFRILLDPVFDADFPQFPEETMAALPYADWNAIETEASPPELSAPLEGHFSEDRWCRLFELADLARQRGDWAQVAALGDEAIEQGLEASHASE